MPPTSRRSASWDWQRTEGEHEQQTKQADLVHTLHPLIIETLQRLSVIFTGIWSSRSSRLSVEITLQQTTQASAARMKLPDEVGGCCRSDYAHLFTSRGRSDTYPSSEQIQLQAGLYQTDVRLMSLGLGRERGRGREISPAISLVIKWK